MGFFGTKKTEHAPTTSHRAYGIEDAIKLMRTLPAESPELIVRVVKNTLESVDVHLGDIIEDAGAKQKHIVERVSALQQQIGDLENEIKTRREEISGLQVDLEETSSVKERLEAVEAAGRSSSPAMSASSSGERVAHPATEAVAVPKVG